jgi:DNA polymerase-3 subunit epsilon
MSQMVARAVRVVPIVCASRLEANVRELRLIAEHDPPYNRRSRRPERAPRVKLTVAAFPRLSVVREVKPDGAAYLGPFGSAQQARSAIDALHEAFALRQCSQRLPLVPRQDARSCLLAELGRCGAPCVGQQSVEAYGDVVSAARAAIEGCTTPVVDAALRRVDGLSAQQRFEEAADHRDRLLAFLRAASRRQRTLPLARMPEVVAALPKRGVGGRSWEIALIRFGRLAGATVTPAGADPMPHIRALQQSGEVVAPPSTSLPAAHVEETEAVLRWLEQPGVRLVEAEGDWTCPVGGAAGALARFAEAQAARARADGIGQGVSRQDRRTVFIGE